MTHRAIQKAFVLLLVFGVHVCAVESLLDDFRHEPGTFRDKVLGPGLVVHANAELINSIIAIDILDGQVGILKGSISHGGIIKTVLKKEKIGREAI